MKHSLLLFPLLAESAEPFPPIRLLSVDDVFGGLDTTLEAHFSDGRHFDEIYPGK
jgi:ABC-type sulfate transport system substrate-binding protein